MQQSAPVNPPNTKRVEKAQALAEAAFDVLMQHDGQMTAEELAQGLGISRATFFRTFGSKEALMLQAILGRDEAIEAAILAAPHAEGSFWPLMRAGFEPIVLRAEADVALFQARIARLRNVPELSAGLRKTRQPRIALFTAALEQRGASKNAASVLAAAGLAALEQVLAEWSRTALDEPLRLHLDRAFTVLAVGA